MNRNHLISEILERLFTVFAIIITSGAFIPLIETGGVDIESVFTPVQFIMLSVVYSITGLLLLPRLNALISLLGQNTLLLLFLGFLLVSSSWAVNPGSSALSAIAAAATSLLAFYLVLRFSIGDVLILLAVSIALLVISSVAFAYLVPSLGQHYITGSWRGVFINRNSLATYSALGVLTFLFLFFSYSRARIVSVLLIALCWWVLVKTGSRTSTIAMGVVLLQCLAFRFMYRAGFSKAMVTAIVVFILLPAAALFLKDNWNDILHMVGRDTKLSGRAEAWDEVVVLGMERPILGYGNLTISEEVPPPHNMILALWLKGGVIGVAFFLMMYLLGFVRAAVISHSLPWPGRYFYTSVLTFLFVRGTMEGLYFTTFLWVLLIVALTAPRYTARMSQASSSRHSNLNRSRMGMETA